MGVYFIGLRLCLVGEIKKGVGEMRYLYGLVRNRPGMFCGAVALYAVFALTTLNLSLCGHGQAEEITIFPDDERSDITPQASTSETSVWAWGENGYGQLGIGSIVDRKRPVKILRLKDVVDIATGAEYCFALKSDDTVWAWGSNSEGQLGIGTTTPSRARVPVKVKTMSGVIDIACNDRESYFVKSDGTVYACGYNSAGLLGIGTYDDKTTPVKISSLSSVDYVSPSLYHCMALQSDGTVWAWGGIEGVIDYGITPVKVSGLPYQNIIDISCGLNYSLALAKDGEVLAWGNNVNGLLGTSTGNISTPTRIKDFRNVVDIASGLYFNLALKSDGTVWAWGDGQYGQLGIGTTTDKTTPVKISGLSNIVDIACGYSHSLALKDDGTVYAWGDNSAGELGIGTTTTQLTPVQIREVNRVRPSYFNYQI